MTSNVVATSSTTACMTSATGCRSVEPADDPVEPLELVGVGPLSRGEALRPPALAAKPAVHLVHRDPGEHRDRGPDQEVDRVRVERRMPRDPGVLDHEVRFDRDEDDRGDRRSPG